MVGIPFLARAGGNDETVPCWHSRRFVRVLLQQAAFFLGSLIEPNILDPKDRAQGDSTGVLPTGTKLVDGEGEENVEIVLDEVPGNE